MKKSLLFPLICLFSCVSNHGEDDSKATDVSIKGTFVQPWLCSSWNDAQWEAEFASLKEAGMEYLIIAPALHNDEYGKKTAVYPSSLAPDSPDMLEKCLQHAQKNGFKIFIGLNMDERWWKVDYTDYWLYEQMEIGNLVADEILRRYKSRYAETLYGWYWVWEVDNLNCNTEERRNILSNALNINLDHLEEVSPDMPLMLSPFVNYRVGDDADGCRRMWEGIFAKTHFRAGDIFAPQDCIGAGGLTLDRLPVWLDRLNEAVKSKPGLLCWSNVENFDSQSWTSATIDRYAKQIELAKPFVSGMITFSYCHYYSPSNCNGKLHNAYLYYRNKGELPVIPVPAAVSEVTYEKKGQETCLTWKLPTDQSELLGIRIYKSGSLLKTLQMDKNAVCAVDFTDPNPSDGPYEVSTYNVVGGESSKIKAISK